jgi:(2Fe-2S) ferredoxin
LTEKPEKLVMCVNRRFQLGQRSCAGSGSEAIADAIEQGILERRIDLGTERIVCLGQCTKGPSMRLAPGGRFYFEMLLEKVPELLEDLETACGKRKVDDNEALAHLLGS